MEKSVFSNTIGDVLDNEPSIYNSEYHTKYSEKKADPYFSSNFNGTNNLDYAVKLDFLEVVQNKMNEEMKKMGILCNTYGFCNTIARQMFYRLLVEEIEQTNSLLFSAIVDEAKKQIQLYHRQNISWYDCLEKIEEKFPNVDPIVLLAIFTKQQNGGY